MELSELTAYADEKYQIREQHNWADLPGLSVLCHPKTGKWIALLMRQWDPDTGTEIEKCDLKSGSEGISGCPRPYLSAPVRMHGSKWIGVSFDSSTESDIVFWLFDRAVASDQPIGYTVVLPSGTPAEETVYRETALPFANSAYQPAKEIIPERLREMRRLFEYGSESVEARAKNFYRQAVFMQEYEDTVPWSGAFVCYFPTYHDLTVRQLRGYFTWRSKVRRGVFEPIAASAAYIYLYELLNGIGAASPEDALMKLAAFEKGYLDTDIGDKRMKQNLRRWMLEYAVLHGLPPETARTAADPELIEKDGALFVLKTAASRSDEEVFSALCAFGGYKPAESPVIALDAARGMRLFSEAWRKASAFRLEQKDLFTLCFGKKKTRQWHPLSNAVYYERTQPKDTEYILDECRSYSCKGGVWRMTAYEKLSFDRVLFTGFLRETDARLRRSFKTGRYLKERPEDEWAIPFIEAAIADDRKAQAEASKPKITIDLSGLEQIRKDAEATRDSLLTEEETDAFGKTAEAEAFIGTAEAAETESPVGTAEAEAFSGTDEAEAPFGTAEAQPEPFEENEAEVPVGAADGTPSDLPLDGVQIRILRTMLRGEDVSAIIKENRLLPSVTADFINEALFDEIGDSVLICENDRLSVVEDYIEDLEQLLGGSADG